MTAPPPLVRPARQDDSPALTETLAQAFYHDPFYNWLVWPDPMLDARLRLLAQLYLARYSRPHGLTWCSHSQQSVAIWAPPGRTLPSPYRQARHLSALAQVTGWRQLGNRLRGLNELDSVRPLEPHACLMTLAVSAPACEELFVPTLLPGLDHCRRRRWPVYLTTATEQRIPRFEALDFRLTGEITLPQGPRTWLMWRDGH